MAQLSEQRWHELIDLWLLEVRGWDRHWDTWHIDADSELALDDRLLPGAPTSGSAIIGIQSAVDHMAALGDALRSSGLRRPFGYFTLARAAMYASARTIWILSPDIRERRQERGLWVEWQSDRHFRKTLLQFQNQPDPGPRATANEMAEQVVSHQEMLTAAAARIGVELAPRHAPTDTEIVEEAGRWLEGVHADVRLGSGLAWQWRTHSGTAHSLPWVTVGKVDLTAVYPDGTGEGTLTPSLEDLGLAFGTAMRATSEAIDLFNARASGAS